MTIPEGTIWVLGLFFVTLNGVFLLYLKGIGDKLDSIDLRLEKIGRLEERIIAQEQRIGRAEAKLYMVG